jgi:hypothetical protein
MQEFKTALEWYSVVALRTGPDFEDEDPGLEGEISRQKLPADLVPTWQRDLEGVEAAPPVEQGDRCCQWRIKRRF